MADHHKFKDLVPLTYLLKERKYTKKVLAIKILLFLQRWYSNFERAATLSFIRFGSNQSQMRGTNNEAA